MKMLERGSTAPGFSLFDQSGTNVVLSDERDHWVVVFFCPAVTDPLAVAISTGFRNVIADFDRLQARLFGIYTDETEQLSEFATTHTIPFPLLSDMSKNIAIQYGAYAAHGIFGHYNDFEPRTYIIAPDGTIMAVYTENDPLHLPAQVVKDLEAFQKEWQKPTA